MGHGAERKGLGAWGREIFEFGSRNAAFDELRRDKAGKTLGETARRREGRSLGPKAARHQIQSGALFSTGKLIAVVWLIEFIKLTGLIC